MRRRRISFELLACARHGHALAGVGSEQVRPQDHHVVREYHGTRFHRCLRCDAWVTAASAAAPGAAGALTPYPPGPDELVVPLRGRALRDRFVLRLIAVDRAFHFVALTALSTGLFLVASHVGSLREDFYRVLADLQGPIAATTQHPHGFVKELRHLLSLKVGTIHTAAAIAGAYALLEGAEAIGLWMGRRWAEYLTFIATAALLPVEVYELSQRLSVFKIGAFVINVAVVIYLAYAKRLFGLRGGGAADEAQRTADGGWPAVQRATPPPPPA